MGAISIRPPELGERETVHWIVASSGTSTPDDSAQALSLLDKAMNGLQNDTGLQAFLLEDGGLPVGFLCIGPTPWTEGTWSLHAIGVDRHYQHRGLGRHLVAFAEGEARRRGGRLMVTESRLATKESADRSFFERAGYRLVARIPGFYRAGEDKLVFAKELERVPSSKPR